MFTRYQPRPLSFLGVESVASGWAGSFEENGEVGDGCGRHSEAV